MTALLPRGPAAAARWPAAVRRWVTGVVRTARPRQWPKNLLVFAAPLAGASSGRDDGIGYGVAAFAAFTAASCAVYFINDVADAGRDRRHPDKCLRPVASGALPVAHAVAIAVIAGVLALASGLWIGVPWLSVIIATYLLVSLLYSLVLKHVPVVELACVASGFLLRALGGAAATRVPPSGWFLAVCSLGALTVAITKRRGELAALGPAAARHRPVLQRYSYRTLSAVGHACAVSLLAAYGLWAVSSGRGWRLDWHLLSIVPLALALIRFDWLSARVAGRPVEEVIIADRIMISAELAWLMLFGLGLGL
jgi:decaprenyl-phosphate phosphoribosyltransferase